MRFITANANQIKKFATSELTNLNLFDGEAFFGRLLCFSKGQVVRYHRHEHTDELFDVVEGESEIVAGHMVEYSGMAYAQFMLAEYSNMILIAFLTVIMFFGGWSSPIDSTVFNWIPSFPWLLIKVFCIFSLYLWFRATFPRYRYDQIMRLGWKVFIPVTLVWLVVIAGWMQTPWSIFN